MVNPPKKILVVDDEPHIVMGLRDAFEFEGFRVVSADHGKAGVALARSESPDVIILDLTLPDMNGYAVCEQVRRNSRLVPIIMLTARSQDSDKIRGLDAGADDYVTKPFSIGELIARVRAILRRASRGGERLESLRIGDAVVNFATHSLKKGKVDQQLSYYELELLKLLAERASEPVSRDEILAKVWGLEAGPSNRTVDNFIVKLRRKLESQPDKPVFILTVHGFGYKLVLEPPPGRRGG